MPRIYDDYEAGYMREIEAERMALSGPTCQYYSLNRGVNVDPLYNEPTADPLYGNQTGGSMARHAEAFNFTGPVDVVCGVMYVEADQRSPSTDEGGTVIESDGEVYIARNEWEEKFPGRRPKEGDVLYVNHNWWDVANAGSSGNVLDTQEFVGFKLIVKYRSKFMPDRKV